jgi:DNA-binding NtrC family response regulator
MKLLRVLQSREFQRGDTEPRRLAGKVIGATHCNIEQAIGAGAVFAPTSTIALE